MADTEKQNFRYDRRRWAQAVAKASVMRNDGYDVDMTVVLTAAVNEFIAETMPETAVRLGLTRADGPVRVYRKRYPRAAGEA